MYNCPGNVPKYYPGNMPKYYPGLRDILPDRRGGNIWGVNMSLGPG